MAAKKVVSQAQQLERSIGVKPEIIRKSMSSMC